MSEPRWTDLSVPYTPGTPQIPILGQAPPQTVFANLTNSRGPHNDYSLSALKAALAYTISDIVGITPAGLALVVAANAAAQRTALGLVASATTDTTNATNITSGTLPDARLTNTGTAGTYGAAGSVPVFTTDGKGRITGVTPTAITPAAIGAADLTGATFTGLVKHTLANDQYYNGSATFVGGIGAVGLIVTAPTDGLRIRGDQGIYMGAVGSIAMSISASNQINFAGATSFGSNTAAVTVTANGQSGGFPGFQWQKVGVTRFGLFLDSSDALSLLTYNSSGTFINNVFTVNNTTGVITGISPPNAASGQEFITAGWARANFGSGGTSGTVTSVAGSGGMTGLTFSGGPVTSAGTLTLGGTLAVGSGGTGAATLTGYVKGTGTTAMTASATIPFADLTGVTPAAVGAVAKAGDTMSGNLTVPNVTLASNGAIFAPNSTTGVFVSGGSTFNTNGAGIALRGQTAGTNAWGLEFYTGGNLVGTWASSGSLSLTTALGIASGGTGSTTAAGALTALGGVNRAGDTLLGNFRMQGATNWGNTYIYGAGTGTRLVAQSATGDCSFWSGTRASDDPNTGTAPIGIMGFAAQDAKGYTKNDVWAGYFESRRYPGCAGGAEGIEIDITNFGSTVQISPYNMYAVGSTKGLWLASGGETGAASGYLGYDPFTGLTNLVANAASAYMGILSNGPARALKGIVFAKDALIGNSGTGGGFGEAIVMPTGDYLTWYDTGGTLKGSLGAQLSTSAPVQSMTFQDGGLFYGNGTGTVHQILMNSAYVNGIQIVGSATAQATQINAIGTDTNISIYLNPKGNGSLSVGGGVSAAGFFTRAGVGGALTGNSFNVEYRAAAGAGNYVHLWIDGTDMGAITFH